MYNLQQYSTCDTYPEYVGTTITSICVLFVFCDVCCAFVRIQCHGMCYSFLVDFNVRNHLVLQNQQKLSITNTGFGSCRYVKSNKTLNFKH